MRAVMFIAALGAVACADDGGETTGTTGSDGTDGVPDVVAGDSSVDAGDDDASEGDTGDSEEGSDATMNDVEESDASTSDAVSEDVKEPVICTVGLPCDDENDCTWDDACGDDGFCNGKSYTCEDDRECTVDVCTGDGDCEYELALGTCLIANVCYTEGGNHALNECVVCTPATSTTEWVLSSDGVPCGGGLNECLTKSTCAKGQCQSGLKACDDGNPCTDDACDELVGCVGLPNADPCDDGNACTQGDTCQFGECIQGLIPLLCDDKNPCTADLCSPSGCVYSNLAGPCADATACTVGDLCQDGTCKPGILRNCDDGNNCTIDSCDQYLGCIPEFVNSACCIGGVSICDDKDPCTTDSCDEEQGACVHTPNTAACDDGNACSGPDVCSSLVCSGPVLDCNDGNSCTEDSCAASLGGCQSVAIPGTCTDNNACTKEDKCVGGTCAGNPLSCNDGQICTQDSCNPLTGCTTVALTGTCNDGNACTDKTVCTPAGCVGVPTACSDGNPCTNDSCNPLTGCAYQAIAGSCDDGLSCSTGDACKNGVCSADKSKCGCQPVFSDNVSHVKKLLMGTSGVPGQGLDVDKKANTCTPEGSCSGGIDNAFSLLADIANPELEKSFASGSLTLLYEHVAMKTNGQTFVMNFYPGNDPGGCDGQTQSCGYYVEKSALNQTTCKPVVAFNNAKIVGNKFTAGGPGSTFPFSAPVQDGLELALTLSNASIDATVTVAGGKITSMTGVLGGAIAKEAIMAAIDAVDPSSFPAGLTKDSIKGLLGFLLANDIDTNGDGTKDAVSIGLVFDANAGFILGLDD